MDRHSADQIEYFLQNRNNLNPSVITGFKIMSLVFGGIGSFLLGLFSLLGILSSRWPYIPIIVFYLFSLTFFAIYRLIMKRNKIKTELPIDDVLRTIIGTGRLINARIERVESRISVTFYINADGLLLKFSTQNPLIMQKYISKDNIRIYYSTEYPDVIIPYFLIDSAWIQKNKDEYYQTRII